MLPVAGDGLCMCSSLPTTTAHCGAASWYMKWQPPAPPPVLISRPQQHRAKGQCITHIQDLHVAQPQVKLWILHEWLQCMLQGSMPVCRTGLVEPALRDQAVIRYGAMLLQSLISALLISHGNAAGVGQGLWRMLSTGKACNSTVC